LVEGSYKIRKITEEENIEHPQLRKMNMFEIYIKYNQIPKQFPLMVFKEKLSTFYLHKKELSNLKNLQSQSQSQFTFNIDSENQEEEIERMMQFI
jgi:hypothetical protein